MAGFEVVVRPVVFPNIRPSSPRSLPPQDDPEKGFATIRGNGAQAVELPGSHSMSMSKSRSTETERRVDEVRVYQEEDDGTVNRENFVDIDVANKINMRGGMAPTTIFEEGQNLRTISRQYREEHSITFWSRPIETRNIEITKTDVIKTSNSDQGSK